VDGIRRAVESADNRFVVNTAALNDGPHHFAVVAIADDLIQQQGRQSIFVKTKNRDFVVEAELDSSQGIRLGQEITIRGDSPTAAKMMLACQDEVLFTSEGAKAEWKLNTLRLGLGKVVLRVAAATAEGAIAFSDNLELEILEPLPIPPVGNGPLRGKSGVAIRWNGGDWRPVKTTGDPGWFSASGAEPNKNFEIEGRFEAKDYELFQFHFGYEGNLQIELNNRKLHEGADSPFAFHFVPVALSPGIHHVRIKGTTSSGTPTLHLGFGGAGVRGLDMERFRHGG
jgi:hypothetical protein